MTYKESYEKCKTLKELEEEINNDIATAITIGNLDRLKIIKRDGEEVANKKFKTELNIC